MILECTCTDEIATNELTMLVLGAVLGLLTSMLTLLIQGWLNKTGKLNVFYRFCYQRGMGGKSWGFDDGGAGKKFFVIPVVFEIQNTSNTTRVIRDVSMLLYNGNNCVGKMLQMPGYKLRKFKGKEEEEQEVRFGAEKESYSFVISPRSIQRQECEYMFIINASQIDENMFDNIRASYYDERNKIKYFKIRKIENCWVDKYYPIDEDWKMFEKI